VEIRHVAPLYLQKLALTLPTSGGRSVGIVRSRTQATEFVVFLLGKILPFIPLVASHDTMCMLLVASHDTMCMLLTNIIRKLM
jgi:hypothetical protein